MVEPGVVETIFNERARKDLEKYIPSLFYSKDYESMLDEGGLTGADACEVGGMISKAVEVDNPRKRYEIPTRAKFIIFVNSLPPLCKVLDI